MSDNDGRYARPDQRDTLPTTPSTSQFICKICASDSAWPAAIASCPRCRAPAPCLHGRAAACPAHGLLRIEHLLLDGRWHPGTKVAHADHALAHAAPQVALFQVPFAQRARARCNRRPTGASRLRSARRARSCACPGGRPRPSCRALRSRHHGGGARMERDHVHVLVEQRHGGIPPAGGSNHVVEPHHLDGGLGLTERMPSVKALMPRSTSGMGKPATNPPRWSVSCGLRQCPRDSALVIARIGGNHHWGWSCSR